MPDDEAIATILAALETGIGYLDAAPLYGTGLAERRLGKALAAFSGKRPLISTKVGYIIEGPEGGYLAPADRHPDFSPAGLRRSVEASLTRLGLDRVDIVFIHEPEAAPEQAAAAFETLARMREDGLFDAIGVGTNRAAAALSAMTRHPLDVVLIAGRYTLLDRSATVMLDRCAAQDVAVVAAGVFNSGILAAPDPRHGTFDYGPASADLVAGVTALHEICARFEVQLKAAALQFPGRDPRVGTTMIGAASQAELAECLAGLALPLPEALWPALAATIVPYAR